MCMGNTRKIYAHWKDQPLRLIHSDVIQPLSWEAADHVIALFVSMWEQLYCATWMGDFYALWEGELYIYTQQPDCPVVWQKLEYGKELAL